MNEELLKMTNKELMAYCVRNNIDVDSKNVSKPTKIELHEAISAAGDLMEPSLIENEGIEDTDEDIDAWLDTSPDTLEDKISAHAEKKLTRSQMRKQQWDEAKLLVRVLITENDNNQTTIPTQVHFTTWGNRLIGH